MNREIFDDLQRRFLEEALDVIGGAELPDGVADRAMISEPQVRAPWWNGVFLQSQKDDDAIIAAANAFASGNPRPHLSLAQRGRFALRLRLASRILRAYGSKNSNLNKSGWFPSALLNFPQNELIEWMLLDGAEIGLEIFDETLQWADGIS